MNTPLIMSYVYTAKHFPNNVSWYRELVHLDDKLVGEIWESCESTTTNNLYRVLQYVPLQLSDGDIINVHYDVAKFSTVSECKEFINSGGFIDSSN